MCAVFFPLCVYGIYFLIVKTDQQKGFFTIIFCILLTHLNYKLYISDMGTVDVWASPGIPVFDVTPLLTLD